MSTTKCPVERTGGSRWFGAALCMMAAGLIAGCTTRGPVASKDLPLLVTQGLPKDSGTVIRHAPGEWFPNVKGFNDIRSNPFAPLNRQAGMLVLTPDALFFEQWNQRTSAYDVVKRLWFRDIEQVELDRYGASQRIVVRRKDLGYDSFGVTQAGGLLVDRSASEDFFNTLEKFWKDVSPAKKSP